MDRAAQVHMVLGREDAGHSASSTVCPEQQSARRSGETRPRKITPAVPPLVVGIGRGPARNADVLLQLIWLSWLVAHSVRSEFCFLVSAIPLAQFRPLRTT